MPVTPRDLRRALPLTLACVAALGGCARTLGPAATVTVPAAGYGTRVIDWSGITSGVPGCIPVSLTYLDPPGAAEVQVGFDNRRYDSGHVVDCDIWQLYDYKGLIAFDLSSFTEAVVVDHAELRLDRAPTTIPWRLPATAKEVCVLELRAAATDWLDPYVRGRTETADIATESRIRAVRLPLLATTTTTPTTVDVTSIALSWLTSPRLPSHGLVLVHRKPDGSGVDHTSNDSCTNAYAGAQLVLTYRPIVARAP